MPSNMGSVTQLALNAITDEQLLQDKYSTPEEVLDYLQEESNFKSLSTLLKETMIAAGVCTESDPETTFIDNLYTRLVKQDNECKTELIEEVLDYLQEKSSLKNLSTLLKEAMIAAEVCTESESDAVIIDKLYDCLVKEFREKKRNKITVERWVSGKKISGAQSKSIAYRYDAIEICFALKLNLDLSNEFLNKCGYNSFNIRNAEDATYLYCIINDRPLSAAKRILFRFLCIPCEQNENRKIELNNHSGRTTIILENELFGNSSWENDDSFLNTYLIPNKAKFTGYSLNAINEYYKWKNNLWFTIISDAVTNELEAINLLKIVDGVNPDPINDFFPTLLAIQSAINKHNDEQSILNQVYLVYEKNRRNINALLDEILKTMKACNDIESRVQLASFFSDIFKTEGLLKRTIECLLRNTDGRLREYGKSELKASVMKEFPKPQTFAKLEETPSSMYNGLSVRKAIILMFYIVYAYELTAPFHSSTSTYTLESSGELGFVEFMNQLNNKVLSNCRLPKLYPANQFDWLILRSIREFEVHEPTDENDPIAFFNEVLACSFGDVPTDED